MITADCLPMRRRAPRGTERANVVVLPVGTTLDDGEKELILENAAVGEQQQDQRRRDPRDQPKTLHNKARPVAGDAGRQRDHGRSGRGLAAARPPRGWAPIHTTQGRPEERLLPDLDGIALLLDAAGQSAGRFPVREGGRGCPFAPALPTLRRGRVRSGGCSARRPGAAGRLGRRGPHGTRAPRDPGRPRGCAGGSVGPATRGRAPGGPPRSALESARGDRSGRVSSRGFSSAWRSGESKTRGGDERIARSDSEVGRWRPRGPASDMSAVADGTGALAVRSGAEAYPRT